MGFLVQCFFFNDFHRFATPAYTCEQQPSGVDHDGAPCLQQRGRPIFFCFSSCVSCAAQLLCVPSVQRHYTWSFLSVSLPKHTLCVPSFKLCSSFYRWFQSTEYLHLSAVYRHVLIHGRVAMCCKCSYTALTLPLWYCY